MFKIFRTTLPTLESTTIRYIYGNNKGSAVAVGHSARSWDVKRIGKKKETRFINRELECIT